ncbi:MAG: SAM-dependent methyltransferase [Lachnospiraceae bacterium]|nr:SAM-dependent methyltransferase [Lachnospiraceae bacterium]
MDIGTDHAYVPIYLVEKGIRNAAIACDIGSGPLAIAESNIKKYGQEGHITTCLSDGLDRVHVQSGDSLIIAGMGGLLIRDIISRGADKAGMVAELILQPQSEMFELRSYLCLAGFEIRDENALIEDGKYYFVIKACPSVNTPIILTDEEKEFGPLLLAKRHPVLKEYLLRQIGIEKEILIRLEVEGPSGGALKRREELVTHISVMERTIERYYEMQ